MVRKYFNQTRVYVLSALDASTMVKRVKKVSGNNEKLQVPDLVEPKRFIKLMDIDHDWAIEYMHDEDVEL